ncbi:hypothetical protein PVAP13_7KG028929 [Panicum virgatum]|uniref:Uncharacterized protein n=1 Tax=Panicum virgatum TaxID=38727 RepID=A0A8T0QAP6_PANVG|nr:hypothetical protein PVAP13_7KG028929 [Panicum virgatum]
MHKHELRFPSHEAQTDYTLLAPVSACSPPLPPPALRSSPAGGARSGAPPRSTSRLASSPAVKTRRRPRGSSPASSQATPVPLAACRSAGTAATTASSPLSIPGSGCPSSVASMSSSCSTTPLELRTLVALRWCRPHSVARRRSGSSPSALETRCCGSRLQRSSARSISLASSSTPSRGSTALRPPFMESCPDALSWRACCCA